MQPPEPHFDAEQDAELRAVPVPEGLQRRLRHVALADDDGLDAALRAVPVPTRLIERLRLGVLAGDDALDDDDLDAAIADVPIPAGLAGRLRRAVLVDDEGFDAVIRDVPVPVDLAGRLDRTPKSRLRLARLIQWATAVSLVVAIGLSYVGAVIGLVALSYPAPEQSRPELDTSLECGWSELAGDGVRLAPGNRLPEPRRPEVPRPGGNVVIPQIVLERDPAPRRFDGSPDVFDIRGSSNQWLRPQWDDANRVLTKDPIEDFRRSELRLVPGLIPEGIRLPLVPGYPRDFFIQYGVLGVVPPAAHAELQSTVVPLGIDTASYDLARRNLDNGRWPPVKLIRTEEFLAAVDYQFPRPRRRAVEVHTAAGPSPFGYDYPIAVEGRVRNVRPKMLQIGMQARDVGRRQHAPVHLVLLVDVSASMCWGGRLEMTRGAISRLVEYLGPDDRVSLVAFSEEAELLIEGAGREHAAELRTAAELLTPQASTHLAEGLRKAYSVMLIDVDPGRLDTRVVLLTDGRAEVAASSQAVIERRLGKAATRGVTLDVIDLRQDDKEPHSQMASFARAGGGKIHQATGADQIGWALQESLTGRSQLVAEGVKLEVEFNPRTVLAYRLIGHEPKLGGVLPADPQADFHAGRSATALYEVWLRPATGGSGGDEVATAELTFTEPGGEKAQTVSRSVHRRDFGSKFVAAPLSLQEAIIVAQAAEVLRRSPFARVRPDDPRSMAGVLAQAKHVDTELYSRPSFARFMSLVEQAEGVK